MWLMLLPMAKLATRTQALVIQWVGLTGIIWNRSNADVNGDNKTDGRSLGPVRATQEELFWKPRGWGVGCSSSWQF